MILFHKYKGHSIIQGNAYFWHEFSSRKFETLKNAKISLSSILKIKSWLL